MALTESILTNIKELLNIASSDTAFDAELLVHINSAFMTLNQLGVGPTNVFELTGNSQPWTAFLTDISQYSAVKTYVFLKVRLAFDPPGTGFVLESIKEQIKELEFRLMIQVPIPPDPTQ